MIYKEDQINIREVLDMFNGKSAAMKFTLEMECDNKINFLDITIQKTEQN